MGIGFYDRLPILIEATIQLPRRAVGTIPDISRLVEWVYRLGSGRLWYQKPVCIGFYAGLLLIEEEGRHGIEVILVRKDI